MILYIQKMRKEVVNDLDIKKECIITMTDFEKMIREMVDAGAKMEDIAKATGDTLNAIQKEQSEKKNGRTARYEELEEKFHQRYAEGRFDVGDVAILAALVVTPDYPEWTVDNINEFVDGITETIKMRAELVGKSPIDGIVKILDMASEIGKEKAGVIFGKVPVHDKASVHKCGSDGKCTCKDTRSDKDKVNQFLADLGLDIKF